MIYRFISVLAASLFLISTEASAHSESAAYLILRDDGQNLSGRLDMALDDLDRAVALDINGDGDLTWGEVKTAQSSIASYVGERITLTSSGARCELFPEELALADRSDGPYAVMTFDSDCQGGSKDLQIDYRLFFDIDARHRGRITLESEGDVRVATARPASGDVVFVQGTASLFSDFVGSVEQGIIHILEGFDHLLFLFTLLLPAVMTWERQSWRPAAGLRPSLMSVAAIVTSFSVAHSITLSLAGLGIVSLPPRFVEAAIAASVVIVAVNNIYPIVTRRIWLLTFAFGLIHGFGFANVLQELDLPGSHFALILFGFNLGVELGQLAIVAIVVPLLFVVRGLPVYRHVAIRAASGVTVAVGLVWFAERVFGVDITSLI